MTGHPRCSICGSNRRADVDSALSQGQSIRQVAARFGFGRNAVHGHRRHVDLAASEQGGPTAQGRQALRAWTRILRRAERKGDVAVMARAQEAIDGIHARSPQPHKNVCRDVVIHVIYDKPKLDPIEVTDVKSIVSLLSRIIKRPETSTAIVACASRLGALLQGKVLPPAVEAAITEIEKRIDDVPHATGILVEHKKLDAEVASKPSDPAEPGRAGSR